MLEKQVKADPSIVAAAAAQLIKNKIDQNNAQGKSTVLGLATGGTPLPLYKELIRLYQNGELDFSRVITFNLDEYIGLSSDHPQSYHYFMHQNLFKYVNIKNENIHLLYGTLSDPVLIAEHIALYEQTIKEVGGIDIQILGIGGNGHIAFNEPGSDLDSRTHVVDLDDKTRADNQRYFSSLSEVPTRAITMGIGTIMEARQCLLLATGESKAWIIAQAFNKTTATSSIPVTALLQHPNTLCLLDREAASLLKTSTNVHSLFARQPSSSGKKIVAPRAGLGG